jgi:large subunit ribosomal protein L29
MKASDLRNMTAHELAEALKESQKRLFELRFQAATNRLETPDAIRKSRRDIARIKTIQREKERASAPAA